MLDDKCKLVPTKWGWTRFRCILLIKDNCSFINHLKWYRIRNCFWMIYNLDHYKIILFFMSNEFHLQLLQWFYTPFCWKSHEDKRVDVSVKTYSLKFKRVLSNNKLFSSRPIYMYILCHFFMLHWVLLSSQKSYLVCKLVSSIDLSLSDIVFSSWYLWFSTHWQYFSFLNLALNLSPFWSLLYSFTTLPPYFRVNVSLFVKRSSPESSTNKVRFRMFCKLCLSI